MKTGAVFALALIWVIVGYASAEDSSARIEVRASGEVVAPADTVVLALSVATVREDVQDAKDANDRLTSMIYELADSQEVAQPRLLSTDLRFDFEQNSERYGKGQSPFGKGQSARNNQGGPPGAEPESGPLMAHLQRRLELHFDELAQVVRFSREVAGWESVRTTREITLLPARFEVADRRTVFLEATRRAVAHGKQEAALLAEQAGLRLGDAVQVFDDSPNSDDAWGAPSLNPFGDTIRSQPPQDERATTQFAALRKAPSPEQRKVDELPPAQVTIRATVRMVFEARKP